MLQFLTVMLAFLLVACAPSVRPPAEIGQVYVTVIADGARQPVTAASDNTVREVLESAGLELGRLDRVTPSENTLASDGLEIRIVRIQEKFEVKESTLPFERQTIVNYGLPKGETRLQQSGVNGVQQDTYRIVYEDDQETSRSIVRSEVTHPPVPEIVMVGGQESYAPVSITGTLAFLSLDDAWTARESTNERRRLTDTHDLDGKVFSLSPDGKWLLVTRAVPEGDPAAFNRLWLVSTADSQPRPVDLQVTNAVFADWAPLESGLRIAYSTGHPSTSPRGYDADNDLVIAELNSQGQVTKRTPVRDSSCGGQSAWWGTNYTWSPDGLQMAFAQSNLIGLITLKTKECSVLQTFVPPNTPDGSIWIPSLAWGDDSPYLYSVYHEGEPDLPAFHLAALSTEGPRMISLAPLAGAYANPSVSPALPAIGSERPFRVAFLEAIFPENSLASPYRLVVMDRDGSNRVELLPPDTNVSGLDRQKVAWSPDGRQLALIVTGNLWIVDLEARQAQQITGGSVTSLSRWAK